MVPASTLFHYPILLLLADGKVHTQKEMVSFEISKLSISAQDQGETTSKGNNRVASHTGFAIQDLRRAGFITYHSNGYMITDEGRAFLLKHPKGFVATDLKTSESYIEYKKLKKNKSNTTTEPSPIPEQEAEESTPPTPDTAITVKLSDLAASANANLPEALLEAVKKIHPKSFEVLIKRLLLKMNYGKSEDDVVVTDYSKDGGIDAYVKADELGIKKLCCVQAKRYSESVGVKIVRELVGSLAEFECDNGIIITTSIFTKDAKDYNPKKYQILLVDGKQLVDYMIKFGLGIATMNIEVKTVDMDFLNGLRN